MQEETNNVITIIMTADNHLGYTVPDVPPRKREEQRQRQRHAFQQATDFAIGQGVDLFLQAGDLFDTPQPDEQDRSFVAARLAGLKQAGIRVFAVGGVHDTPAESHTMLGDTGACFPAPQLSYASLGALHYFPPGETPAISRHTLQPVLLDIRGVQFGICGLGITTGQQGDPLAHSDTEPELARAAVPLLLLHAPIEGLPGGTPAPNAAAQVSRATLASQSAFRFILAGYHHAFTRLSIGRTEVIIAGATQHTHFNDPEGEPGFVFLGIAPDGVRWCRHISTDGIHPRRLVISVPDLWAAEDGTDQTVTDPTGRILEQVRPLCAADTMVQVRLEGELTRQQYHQLDLSQVRRYGEEHAFAFIIDESAITFVPDTVGTRLIASGTTTPDSLISEEPESYRVQAPGLSPLLVPTLETVPLSAQREERLSPRDELIRLADEWIAAAEDEQEQQALVATKEELLATLWNL